MISTQLANVIRLFSEPSLYQDNNTALDLECVINSLLSQNYNVKNRQKFVITCLLASVTEALGKCLTKASQPEDKTELEALLSEAKNLQSLLTSPNDIAH